MNYLAIISRSDFTNLYKFGHIHLHNLVPFDGNLIDHINDKNLFDAVTKYIDTYEYATEYLLLHMTKEAFTEPIVEININDVNGVYALSEEAKKSIQVSLDSRINIQVSMWESMFAELNIEQAIRQARIGLNNCLEIFRITPSEKSKIYQILPNNLVEEVYHDVFNNVRPSDNASIWNYLMRYERHTPYWNDKRGFFMDAVHVYENHNKGHEIDYGIVDDMPIGDTISDCPNVFTTILQKLNETGENNFNFDGCNYLIVAPLFLYLKAEFKDGGITPSKYEQKRHIFVSLHERYGLDFAIAISLLGLSLGQDLTYNYAYQHNNIGIFNTTQDYIVEVDNISEQDSHKLEQSSEEDLLDTINNQKSEIQRLQLRIQQLEEQQNKAQAPYSNLSNPAALPESINTEYHGPIFATDTNDSLPKFDTQELSGEMPLEDNISDNSEKQPIEQNKVDMEDNPSDSPVISAGESFIPVEMLKLNKDRNSFDRRSSPRWAHSSEEYKMFWDEGFAPHNFFDNQN